MFTLLITVAAFVAIAVFLYTESRDDTPSGGATGGATGGGGFNTDRPRTQAK